MSKWEPISLSELQIKIKKGLDRMSNEQLQIWKQISVALEKWIDAEFGNEGGGFWIVAVDDVEVIWYNDIEEGFNISSFSEYGTIDNYRAEQDELQWAIKKLKRFRNTCI